MSNELKPHEAHTNHSFDDNKEPAEKHSLSNFQQMETPELKLFENRDRGTTVNLSEEDQERFSTISVANTELTALVNYRYN
mgnify:CR=1